MVNLRELVKKLYSSPKKDTSNMLSDEYWLEGHVVENHNSKSLRELIAFVSRMSSSQDPSYTQFVRENHPILVCDKGDIDEVMKENFQVFNYKLFLVATVHDVPLYVGSIGTKMSKNFRDLFENRPSVNKNEELINPEIIHDYAFSGISNPLISSKNNVVINLEGALTNIKKSGSLIQAYTGDCTLIVSSKVIYKLLPEVNLFTDYPVSDVKSGDVPPISIHETLSASMTGGYELRGAILKTIPQMKYFADKFVGAEATKHGTILLKLERKNPNKNYNIKSN